MFGKVAAGLTQSLMYLDVYEKNFTYYTASLFILLETKSTNDKYGYKRFIKSNKKISIH